MTRTSLGPAIMSIPTVPETIFFARVTQIFRPHNHIGPGHRLGAVCQSADGPRHCRPLPPDPPRLFLPPPERCGFIVPSLVGGVAIVICLTPAILPNHAHEHRRDQRCISPHSAGDIHTDTIHRSDELSQQGTRSIFGEPGVPDLSFVKRFDLGGCQTQ